ncbi:MAG: M90 family metallopeptidase, partial [Acidimicrobiia bacterium]|nr:M90 family metallopeptidase [Acidimicrobiia bacterium]
RQPCRRPEPPTVTTTDGLRQGPVAGVYTDHPMAVIGQALPNRGPISLSWDAALVHSRDPGAGRNVVIHEFAHKIDMMDGYSDGIPPLRGAQLTRWTRTLDGEFAQGGSDPSDEVLSPYAWTNTSEFFAVATEAFFCSPHRLGEAKPDLYAALAGWYLQDPAGT